MSLQFHLHKEKQIRKTSGSIYGNTMSHLLARSYEEISAFAHAYHFPGLQPGERRRCFSRNQFFDFAHHHYAPGENPGEPRRCFSYNDPAQDGERSSFLRGVCSMDFDNEGKYIASMTNDCLIVHDFEVLYVAAQQFNLQDISEGVDDEVNHRCHVGNVSSQAIKWNPNNQHEVFIAADRYLDVYNVDDNVLVSELKQTNERHHRLFSISNVAVAKTKSMISASDLGGTVSLWDPKVGNLPICRFNTNYVLSCVQFDVQDQYVFAAAGEKGTVYMWDIRTAGNVSGPPPVSWELPTECMTPPSHFRNDGISSILFNPSSPSMLAFHTRNSWSGILDTSANDNFQLTHIHELLQNTPNSKTQPSWLPACSVYVAPLSNGIRLLDFNSPRSVDRSEAMLNRYNHSYQDVICSQDIISTAAHPFYNAIVAGTERGSMIMISQRRSSHEVEEV